MEGRTLDVIVVSARGLEDVNHISKLRVYVVVSLAGDITSEQKFTTSVDEEGRGDPNWNLMMKFTINETTARQCRQYLVFALRTEKTLGERDVGKVTVPVTELLDSADDNHMKNMTCQVRNLSGKPYGVLNISYKFRERTAAPAYGGPCHNSRPDVYPPPPKPDMQFHPLPSSAPCDVYEPPFSCKFCERTATPAYGGPCHNSHPDVYPPPPKPAIQFHPLPSSAPYGVYKPFSCKFCERTAAPAYGGPCHNSHPDVYPPPKPDIQFHSLPSSAPYGVYERPSPSYGNSVQRWN